ncbi:DMT family transporter [Nonomuraea roseoviolacea]|uniref:DMT family transporter n=1 Tax=Nonomuraea roseoviolacea TaxID=103837 RepID=UPI0031D1F7C8
MKQGPLAVVGASVLWGTAGTAGLLVSADSVALAAARLIIGGAVLALFAGRAVRRSVSPATLLAAAAVAAYQLCFFAAVGRTGVAVGTVVAIGSGPVFTGLLSWALHRERPSGRWALATAAAIAGCAALIAGGGAEAGGPGGQMVAGVLLALLGGLVYAFYAVCAARVIAKGAPSDGVMGVLFGGAAVIMLPVLLWRGAGWLGEPKALLAVLYLGLASTALSYVLYGRGLRTTPVATASTLALAEPAVAALLGLVVLGERLAPVSWAGLALLAVGLVVVALPDRRFRRGAPEAPATPGDPAVPEPVSSTPGDPVVPEPVSSMPGDPRRA